MLQSFNLLVLIGLANAAPILAHMWLGERLSRSVDGGHRWGDGRPVLGRTKTLRGVCAALALCSLGALLLGLSWRLGILIGAGAMAGDLVSSFAKRRLGKAESTPVRGLDQIPESLIPASLAAPFLGIGVGEVLIVTAIFFALETAMSPLLFRLKIRRPCP
ncbi:MAG: CDP-archaeol synthase [Gammaproteobacteria bacterium]